MMRNRNTSAIISAVWMAPAASAREVNGEDPPPANAILGAARGTLAPAPPSIPGDARIDSVTGAAPVFPVLFRSILSSQLLPGHGGPIDRVSFSWNVSSISALAGPLPGLGLAPGKRPTGWAERLAIRPTGPQHTKRLLFRRLESDEILMP